MTVQERVQEHYEEALKSFKEDRIVGIFLQGSQNYGLEVPGSDVDTKLIVVPSFEEIAFNKKPVSTTHVRANDEHIDFKDIRLMFGTFLKQNLNFLEILFTDYKIVNPLYEYEWNKLVMHNEEIACYNPFLAVKAMKGIAMEKYHALEHPYPAKVKVLEKFGYDPKQLHHLMRIEEYIERYIDGENYQSCLRPLDTEYLKAIKLGHFNLEKARIVAKNCLDHITEISNEYCDKIEDKGNEEVEELLDKVQYNIMLKATKKELREEN